MTSPRPRLFRAVLPVLPACACACAARALSSPPLPRLCTGRCLGLQSAFLGAASDAPWPGQRLLSSSALFSPAALAGAEQHRTVVSIRMSLPTTDARHLSTDLLATRLLLGHPETEGLHLPGRPSPSCCQASLTAHAVTDAHLCGCSADVYPLPTGLSAGAPSFCSRPHPRHAAQRLARQHPVWAQGPAGQMPHLFSLLSPAPTVFLE